MTIKLFFSIVLTAVFIENYVLQQFLGICPFLGVSKKLDSALDAIGMGIGFTLTLFVMASIREIFGNGTWFGMGVPILKDNHISIMTMAPGGFFVFGCLIAAVNKWFVNKPKQKDFGCEGCPAAATCGGAVPAGAAITKGAQA